MPKNIEGISLTGFGLILLYILAEALGVTLPEEVFAFGIGAILKGIGVGTAKAYRKKGG